MEHTQVINNEIYSRIEILVKRIDELQKIKEVDSWDKYYLQNYIWTLLGKIDNQEYISIDEIFKLENICADIYLNKSINFNLKRGGKMEKVVHGYDNVVVDVSCINSIVAGERTKRIVTRSPSGRLQVAYTPDGYMVQVITALKREDYRTDYEAWKSNHNQDLLDVPVFITEDGNNIIFSSGYLNAPNGGMNNRGMFDSSTYKRYFYVYFDNEEALFDFIDGIIEAGFTKITSAGSYANSYRK